MAEFLEQNYDAVSDLYERARVCVLVTGTSTNPAPICRFSSGLKKSLDDFSCLMSFL